MAKAKFYADENIEAYLVEHLRNQGMMVDYAVELGYKPRDDQFHLQEARRRKSILLTRDTDFLDNRKFPYYNLKYTAIVMIGTEMKTAYKLDIGYMLVALIDHIAASGLKNLKGLKIEIKGPRIIFHANVEGRKKRDEIDISQEIEERWLFKDEK